MEKILEFAKRFCIENGEWTMPGRQLIAPVGSNGRKQKLRFKKSSDVYVIETTILGHQIVTKSNKAWRTYAKFAWARNAERDIVNFTFDCKDQLIGSIEHPVEFLDFDEFVVYVNRLAAESDRFEYLLTGKDRW